MTLLQLTRYASQLYVQLYVGNGYWSLIISYEQRLLWGFKKYHYSFV